MGRKTTGGRTTFVFRSGRDDDPIGWKFNYNHVNRADATRGLTQQEKKDKNVDDSIKALVGSEVEFREYHPALLSDYRIRFTDMLMGDGKTKKSFTIDRLEMDVELSAS
jgi:hypothetical protein